MGVHLIFFNPFVHSLSLAIDIHQIRVKSEAVKVRPGSNVSVTISRNQMLHALSSPDGFDVGAFFFCFVFFWASKRK